MKSRSRSRSPIDFSAEKEFAAFKESFEVFLLPPFFFGFSLLFLLLLVFDAAVAFRVVFRFHRRKLVAVDIV